MAISLTVLESLARRIGRHLLPLLISMVGCEDDTARSRAPSLCSGEVAKRPAQCDVLNPVNQTPLSTDDQALPGLDSATVRFTLDSKASAIHWEANEFTIGAVDLVSSVQAVESTTDTLTISSPTFAYKTLVRKRQGSEFTVDTLSTDEKATLEALCGWQKLTEMTTDVSGARAWRAMWRTSHLAETKADLATLEARQSVKIYCTTVLTVSAQIGGAEAVTSTAYLVYDPVPASGQNYLGTNDVDRAILYGLVVLDADLTFSSTLVGTLLDIPSSALQDPETYKNIPAIHPNVTSGDDVFSLTQNQESSDCTLNTVTVATGYREQGGQPSFTLGLEEVAGGRQFTRQYALGHSRLPDDRFRISGVATAADATGAIETSCASLASTLDTNDPLQMTIQGGCDLAQNLSSQGCNLAVKVVNSSDPFNTVAIKSAFQLPTLQAVDRKTAVEAGSIFPAMASNPVDDGTVTVFNFQNYQRQALEVAYNIAHHLLDSTDYQATIANVTRHVYEGPVEACENVSAFTLAGETIVRWCPDGISADQISFEANVEGFDTIHRATVLLHEALHTTGLLDDADADYEPCRGTAYAAVLPAAMYDCTEPFCRAFTGPFALWAVKQELEHSLRISPKRFQGLCQELQQQVGVTIN